MPRRKKYPKLPNGYQFGSIKFLKQKKHNQYAVHPPTTEFTKDGVPITPKALCYVDDWYKGFAVLTAYKAGTYKEGMEKELSFTGNPDDAVKRIIADYSSYKGAASEASTTFSDVFELYYKINMSTQRSGSQRPPEGLQWRRTRTASGYMTSRSARLHWTIFREQLIPAR